MKMAEKGAGVVGVRFFFVFFLARANVWGGRQGVFTLSTADPFPPANLTGEEPAADMSQMTGFDEEGGVFTIPQQHFAGMAVTPMQMDRRVRYHSFNTAQMQFAQAQAHQFGLHQHAAGLPVPSFPGVANAHLINLGLPPPSARDLRRFSQPESEPLHPLPDMPDFESVMPPASIARPAVDVPVPPPRERIAPREAQSDMPPLRGPSNSSAPAARVPAAPEAHNWPAMNWIDLKGVKKPKTAQQEFAEAQEAALEAEEKEAAEAAAAAAAEEAAEHAPSVDPMDVDAVEEDSKAEELVEPPPTKGKGKKKKAKGKRKKTAANRGRRGGRGGRGRRGGRGGRRRGRQPRSAQPTVSALTIENATRRLRNLLKVGNNPNDGWYWAADFQSVCKRYNDLYQGKYAQGNLGQPGRTNKSGHSTATKQLIKAHLRVPAHFAH